MAVVGTRRRSVRPLQNVWKCENVGNVEMVAVGTRRRSVRPQAEMSNLPELWRCFDAEQS
jgi:hypothetical protein